MEDGARGQAIFASGSPFEQVEYEAKVFVLGQANNAYIFPGLGFGLIIPGAIRVRDEMLLAASEALAAQVTEENFGKGLIHPPFTNIRKISAHIAGNVAAKAYVLGLASLLICLDLRILSAMQRAACIAHSIEATEIRRISGPLQRDCKNALKETVHHM